MFFKCALPYCHVTGKTNALYYRPQRSCGKVMFLHLFLSHSIHSGGASVRHLPGQTIPQADPPGQTPQTDNPPSRADIPPAQCMLGYTPRSPAQCMLGYGQQAGGTHPSGMHTCYQYQLVKGLIFRPIVNVLTVTVNTIICSLGFNGQITSSLTSRLISGCISIHPKTRGQQLNKCLSKTSV